MLGWLLRLNVVYASNLCSRWDTRRERSPVTSSSPLPGEKSCSPKTALKVNHGRVPMFDRMSGAGLPMFRHVIRYSIDIIWGEPDEPSLAQQRVWLRETSLSPSIVIFLAYNRPMEQLTSTCIQNCQSLHSLNRLYFVRHFNTPPYLGALSSQQYPCIIAKLSQKK